MDIDWGIALSALAAFIALGAFIWEFGIAGRKQLGYRVQMDNRLMPRSDPDPAESYYLKSLDLRGKDGTGFVDPSLVLVRIENSGTTHIDSDDYVSAEGSKVGMHLHFPGRRVVDMAVTEVSDDFIADSFGKNSGMAKREIDEEGQAVGVIDLPKTSLNRGVHFKVLALLERIGERPEGDKEQKFADPKAVAGIKGGVGRGGIRRTKARTGLPVRATVISSVFLLGVFELSRSLFFGPEPAPLDCATGRITLTGSTALAPVVQEAADLYTKTCPGAAFDYNFRGSAEGWRLLDDTGRASGGSPAMLAFSDGDKEDGYPQLLPRPTAFSLFTVVANPEAKVQDLSLDQIRQIYDGQITNWKQIGGADRPVRLVSRESDSGTRKTFQQQIRGGTREPGSNSDNCTTLDPGAQPGVIRCERTSTNDLLNAVAQTPGALGYSELGAAAGRQDVATVRIDGHEATLEGAIHQAYPFWQTEYAYTYGEPTAQSLAASFLRYLTNQVGRDIVRAHGLRPCAELASPVLCRPS